MTFFTAALTKIAFSSVARMSNLKIATGAARDLGRRCGLILGGDPDRSGRRRDVARNPATLQALANFMGSPGRKRVRIAFADGAVEAVDLRERLGAGRTRSYYAIPGARAVAIPNFQVPDRFRSEWNRIVADELGLIAILEKAGVPVSKLVAVEIQFEQKGRAYTLPSYAATSFAALRESSLAILDVNSADNPFDSFPPNLVGADPIRWADALRPLLDDIRAIGKVGYRPNFDAANMLGVPRGHALHSGGPSPVEYRTFVFDTALYRRATPYPERPLGRGEVVLVLRLYLENLLGAERELLGETKGDSVGKRVVDFMATYEPVLINEDGLSSPSTAD